MDVVVAQKNHKILLGKDHSTVKACIMRRPIISTITRAQSQVLEGEGKKNTDAKARNHTNLKRLSIPSEKMGLSN